MYRKTLLAAFRVLLILAAGTAVASCANKRGGTIPYDRTDFVAPDAPTAAIAQGDYKLAPMDTVTVTVFRVKELSDDYSVDLSGNITMPLVGELPAVGLTTRELAEQIKTQLGQRYLKNPDVTVALKESKRRNVTVEGSVTQPGVYPVAGPLTLLQAVAMARGTNDGANPRRVAIFRTVSGQRMAAAFDLVSIRRGEAEDPQVYAGDIVVIDGSDVNKRTRDILQTLPLVALFAPVL